MEVPKKIDKLLKQRTKLAKELSIVSDQIDQWLIDNNFYLCDELLKDSTITGCMIYCEPKIAESNIRQAIENK